MHFQHHAKPNCFRKDPDINMHPFFFALGKVLSVEVSSLWGERSGQQLACLPWRLGEALCRADFWQAGQSLGLQFWEEQGRVAG